MLILSRKNLLKLQALHSTFLVTFAQTYLNHESTYHQYF